MSGWPILYFSSTLSPSLLILKHVISTVGAELDVPGPILAFSNPDGLIKNLLEVTKGQYVYEHVTSSCG